MPPAQSARGSSTPWGLYTFFIVLILAAAVCAIFFGVQAGNYKTQNEDLQARLNELASPSQVSSLSKIVGDLDGGETYVGALAKQVNELVGAIIGTVPDEDTTRAKVTDVGARIRETKKQIADTLKDLGAEDAYSPHGAQNVALLWIIQQLHEERNYQLQRAQEMERLKNELQDDYDRYVENRGKEVRELRADMQAAMAQADEAQQKFEDLKELMDSSDAAVMSTFQEKFDRQKAEIDDLTEELLMVKAELANRQRDLEVAQQLLEAIKPKPDEEALAYAPDAQIVSVDLQAGVVFLDIGSEDHVYRGLTFSVYDPSMPIPEDGRGKAELEVFHVKPNTSAARITVSNPKNPVVEDDIVANLIWDAKEANQFVVIGDFDIDRDGKVDPDGATKIAQLIERWGGEVVDEVNINTDFIVVGVEPPRMAQPTARQLQTDPMIEDEYAKVQQRRQTYEQVLEQAGKLSVPVFNQDRFFHLIGYETLARKSTPMS